MRFRVRFLAGADTKTFTDAGNLLTTSVSAEMSKDTKSRTLLQHFPKSALRVSLRKLKNEIKKGFDPLKIKILKGFRGFVDRRIGKGTIFIHS